MPYCGPAVDIVLLMTVEIHLFYYQFQFELTESFNFKTFENSTRFA